MEEELIYEIVDCIINNQDKIKELTHKIKHPEENEIYKKEMQYKNSLNSNIKRINKYENEIKINDKIFKEFANKFYAKSDKIDDEISIISEKLNEFDKNNKNKDLYKASYEKFKNMILNKKDKENLKYSKNKLSKINAKNIEISKDMKIIDEERNKLKEIDLMLDEDKNGIDIKIVDYMSLKESYEEIAKQYLKKFILNNINANIENNNVLINENIESYPINENNDMTNIILYSYELNCIDSTKIENEISNQIIYLINNYIKEANDDNNDIINIKSYDKMIKSEDNKNYVNILENNDNNNKLINSIINKTKIYYNKQEIISLTSILSSKIRKKLIEYFVSTNDYIKNKNKEQNIDNLLIVLKDLIISFINIYFPSFINKNHNNPDLLILYIKYVIKYFYYQKIISDNFTFLNEEYKKSKKIIKKNLNLIEKEYNNIQNKKEEYLISKNELEEKMKYLYDNINNNNYDDLTPEEKEYIILNQRFDDLNISKKKLKYDFLKYENEINYNIEKLKYKIEQLRANNKPLRKNILTCQEEIKSMDHLNKLEINKLEKSIKDKFNVIKGQISVYKKKYGDNMELYNRLVGRINETLKETDIENNNFNNYDKNSNYLSDRNSLYNTQSTFYKSNEKPYFKNKFFSPQKNQMTYYYDRTYLY